MIKSRYPHQVGREIAKGINEGRIEFSDKHLSMFPQDLTYGYYALNKKHGDPKKFLDYAIVYVFPLPSSNRLGTHRFSGISSLVLISVRLPLLPKRELSSLERP